MLSSLGARVWAFLTSRMQVWAIVSISLGLLLLVLAPRQIPISLYKLVLVTSAAWVAYWLDRSLFPYARPDAFLDPYYGLPNSHEQAIAFAAAMLRRAWIIGCAMIAVALGA